MRMPKQWNCVEHFLVTGDITWKRYASAKKISLIEILSRQSIAKILLYIVDITKVKISIHRYEGSHRITSL